MSGNNNYNGNTLVHPGHPGLGGPSSYSSNSMGSVSFGLNGQLMNPQQWLPYLQSLINNAQGAQGAQGALISRLQAEPGFLTEITQVLKALSEQPQHKILAGKAASIISKLMKTLPSNRGNLNQGIGLQGLLRNSPDYAFRNRYLSSDLSLQLLLPGLPQNSTEIVDVMSVNSDLQTGFKFSFELAVGAKAFSKLQEFQKTRNAIVTLKIKLKINPDEFLTREYKCRLTVGEGQDTEWTVDTKKFTKSYTIHLDHFIHALSDTPTPSQGLFSGKPDEKIKVMTALRTVLTDNKLFDGKDYIFKIRANSTPDPEKIERSVIMLLGNSLESVYALAKEAGLTMILSNPICFTNDPHLIEEAKTHENKIFSPVYVKKEIEVIQPTALVSAYQNALMTNLRWDASPAPFVVKVEGYDPLANKPILSTKGNELGAILVRRPDLSTQAQVNAEQEKLSAVELNKSLQRLTLRTLSFLFSLFYPAGSKISFKSFKEMYGEAVSKEQLETLGLADNYLIEAVNGQELILMPLVDQKTTPLPLLSLEDTEGTQVNYPLSFTGKIANQQGTPKVEGASRSEPAKDGLSVYVVLDAIPDVVLTVPYESDSAIVVWPNIGTSVSVEFSGPFGPIQAGDIRTKGFEKNGSVETITIASQLENGNSLSSDVTGKKVSAMTLARTPGQELDRVAVQSLNEMSLSAGYKEGTPTFQMNANQECLNFVFGKFQISTQIKDGKQVVVIGLQTDNGMQGIEFSENGISMVASGGDVNVQASNAVNLISDSASVEAKNVNINANQKLHLYAATEADLGAGKLTMGSNGALEVGSPSPANLKTGAATSPPAKLTKKEAPKPPAFKSIAAA
jgi:hypothetical protein